MNLKLAETCDKLHVVNDQSWNLTSALDMADVILAVADNLLLNNDEALRGTFHMMDEGS